MRGLDDALDRLARRDQLRRRAAGESAGTPPAVTELVEAIAAVVSRNPALAVTVGVEGAGDPTLLHFAVEDGIVQVSADNSVAQRTAEQRHDDVIDADLVDPEPYPPANGYHYEQPAAPYEQPVAPHPFAATPPPEVPPQTPHPAAYEQQHHAADVPHQRRSPDIQQTPERGMPAPLPEPIPLQVNEEETEQAARRLAALLREDPSLLRAQD
ncbi:hypothetical protein [Actinoplanes sp. N902-109]|uniref:hypothetical protein n=1 Tax=Actinoplanes sp. (strain N902-109) TaxID=649831 RepID=UPI000329624C|nr:hypothetical protein [Actinoplanes sp. N902-109]AGL21496.1 hypothetical protein L083_7986 [Actinoplanes sp. N902-109]